MSAWKSTEQRRASAQLGRGWRLLLSALCALVLGAPAAEAAGDAGSACRDGSPNSPACKARRHEEVMQELQRTVQGVKAATGGAVDVAPQLQQFDRDLQRLGVAVSTTMAMASMNPDFCLDTRRPRRAQKCTRSQGRVDCAKDAGSSLPAFGLWDATARPSLSLHLAYLAVLRDSGTEGSAGAFLGGGPVGEVDPGWSLAYLNKAVASDQAAGDMRGVVNSLLMMAAGFIRAGDYASAQQQLDLASRRANDDEAKAAILVNRGVVRALQGDHVRALSQIREANALYRALDSRRGGGVIDPARNCSIDVGIAEARKALEARSVRTGLELSLLNLGVLHAQLGQFDQAVEPVRQAISLFPSADGRGAAAGQVAMAAVLQRAGRTDDAMKFAREAAQSGPSLLLALGNAYPTTVAVRPLSDPPAGTERTAKAPVTAGTPWPVPPAAAIARPADPRAALASLRKAALIAEANGSAEPLRLALAGLQQAATELGMTDLAIYYGKRAVNEVQRQRARLADLPRDTRRSFAAASRPVYEALGAALLGRDRLAEAEHALLLAHQDDLAEFGSGAGMMPMNAAERAYASHEQALAQRWRAAAAQRAAIEAKTPHPLRRSPDWVDKEFDLAAYTVVTLLAAFKPLEELDAVMAKLDPGRAASALEARASGIESMLQPLACNGVDLDPRLAALRQQSLELRQRAAALGGARTTDGLAPSRPATRRPAPGSQDENEVSRLKCGLFTQMTAERDAAAPNEALIADLGRDAARLDAADQALLDRNQQALAERAGRTPSVALHYLVTDRRVHVLAVTATRRRAGHADILRSELDAKVAKFRRAIETGATVPFDLAEELHRHLVAPVADVLDSERPALVHLALDGALRRLPFAALRVGQDWLIERFALTLGRPAQTTEAAARTAWRVAGFAAPMAAPGHKQLPGTEEEVRGLLRRSGGQGSGPMDGVAFVGRAFTEAALRQALSQRYPVVHIASHFILDPGSAGDSYLLLGDGARLSLQTIRDELRFDGVELVTLSACETALDGDARRNHFGQEFEGLSTVLRNLGAASVLGTLWQVPDEGPSLLMRVFYAARETQGLSRAEALQFAQLALMRGASAMPASTAAAPAGQRRATDSAGSNARRGSLRWDPPPPDAPTSPTPAPAPTGPYVHPIFWAPFALTGDAS